MDELQTASVDSDPVHLAEQLSRRLGLRVDQVRLELHMQRGHLRRADVHLVALKPDDLRALAKG